MIQLKKKQKNKPRTLFAPLLEPVSFFSRQETQCQIITEAACSDTIKVKCRFCSYMDRCASKPCWSRARGSKKNKTFSHKKRNRLSYKRNFLSLIMYTSAVCIGKLHYTMNDHCCCRKQPLLHHTLSVEQPHTTMHNFSLSLSSSELFVVIVVVLNSTAANATKQNVNDVPRAWVFSSFILSISIICVGVQTATCTRKLSSSSCVAFYICVRE